MLVIIEIHQEILKLAVVDSQLLSPEQLQSQYPVTAAFSVNRLLLVTITNQTALWVGHLLMLQSGGIKKLIFTSKLN